MSLLYFEFEVGARTAASSSVNRGKFTDPSLRRNTFSVSSGTNAERESRTYFSISSKNTKPEMETNGTRERA